MRRTVVSWVQKTTRLDFNRYSSVAMEANEMEPGTRDQSGQALQKFQRRHHDMRGAIAVRGFELQDDVAVWWTSQPFVAKGGTGDVATEAFERGPLIGAAVYGKLPKRSIKVTH